MGNLIDTVFSRPFIYEKVRPFVLGRLDYSEIFGWLGDLSSHSVLDVGCGFGDALKYLKKFKSYHGFDPDARALKYLKSRFPQKNVYTHYETLTEETLNNIQPQSCVAIGILHHLSDNQCIKLFGTLSRSPSLCRVVTLDTVFVKNAWLSNFFAHLDRGRFVRTPEAFTSLMSQAGFKIVKTELSKKRARNGMVYYFSMCLEPGAMS